MLAQIIARIAHKVSSADRAKLENILSRGDASEGVRTLATAAFFSWARIPIPLRISEIAG